MKYAITSAAVIGAGVMGAGIAASLAGAGVPVVLLDIVPPDGLTDDERARGIAEDSDEHRNRLAQAGKNRVADPRTGVLYTPDMADLIDVTNLRTGLDSLRGCGWVIEAAVEDLEAKRALYAAIAPHLDSNAILSTNTSGIPLQRLADVMPAALRARFLGAHFFNPPRWMQLLELIPHADTDPAAAATIEDFCDRVLGKSVVRAKDTPGFIANRVGTYGLSTVLRLMDSYGFDFETVDHLTGPLIGNPKTATFRLLDTVGLDVFAKVADNLRASLASSEDSQSYVMPDYLRAMVAAGQLGRKAERGFYRSVVSAGGRRTTEVWNPGESRYQSTHDTAIDPVDSLAAIGPLGDRLRSVVNDDSDAGRFVWDYLKSVILYSARHATEIAQDYQDIDKAMRWGYNWGAGPFEIWQLLGFAETAARMRADGEKLPQWVDKLLADQRSLYPSDPSATTFADSYPVVRTMTHSVLLDMGDGVAALEIRSPGNAISTQLRSELRGALSQVETDPSWVGMVLLNSGPNFLTGANLHEVADLIEAGDAQRLDEMVRDFQETSLALKYAKKPVVAAIHGMILGGGLEFTMHVPRVVAHADARLGFVEAGVGLIPAGGGIKETLQRLAAEAKPYALPDIGPLVLTRWRAVIAAEVSKNAFHARQMGYLRPTDLVVMQLDAIAERAKTEVLTMAHDGFRQRRPATVPAPGDSVRSLLDTIVHDRQDGGFISAHDARIAKAAAFALTGGDVPKGVLLSEPGLLALERQEFTSLCREEMTLERINGMLRTGRPVHN